MSSIIYEGSPLDDYLKGSSATYSEQPWKSLTFVLADSQIVEEVAPVADIIPELDHCPDSCDPLRSTSSILKSGWHTVLSKALGYLPPEIVSPTNKTDSIC